MKSTRPRRGDIAPTAETRHRQCPHDAIQYINPSVGGLAAEIAALEDAALAEQAALLAAAAQYAVLTPLLLLRLRLVAAELARRLAEREEVRP